MYKPKCARNWIDRKSTKFSTKIKLEMGFLKITNHIHNISKFSFLQKLVIGMTRGWLLIQVGELMYGLKLMGEGKTQIFLKIVYPRVLELICMYSKYTKKNNIKKD